MRKIMIYTFISMLIPLGANKGIHIDKRAYSLEQFAIVKDSTKGFFEEFQRDKILKNDEILVSNSAIIKSKKVKVAPIQTVQLKRKKGEKFSFKSFRSSFKEIKNYWPTKNDNPIFKEKIKIKTIAKVKLPKPTRVQKVKIDPSSIIKDDFAFSVAFASSKDDIIKLERKTAAGAIIKQEISLLTLKIHNHIRVNGSVEYSMPTLAAEIFDVKKLDTKIARIEKRVNELKEEDKLIELAVSELQNDEVKIKQSSITKNTESKIKKMTVDSQRTFKDKVVDEIIADNKSEEMVFLDYSKPQTSPTSVKSNEIISQSVKNVISREMAKVGNQKKILLAAASTKRKSRSQANAKAITDFMAARPSRPTGASESVNFSPTQTIIRPVMYDLNTGVSSNLYEFDFMPSFDLNDIVADAGNGYVKVDYSLSGGFGLLHGSIVHRDTVRLNVDIPMGHEANDYSFPIFELDQFNDFLKENDASTPGGYLLVEYSDGVDSIDIEKYEKVLHLNTKFKPVKESESYEYSLFVGVVPGNNLLRMLTNDGKISEKIIYIYDDELTFTATDYSRSEKIKIELKEESLLGKSSRLSIDSEHLKYFNLPIKSERTALNSYNLEAPPLINGMRRYLEIISDGQLFVVGSHKGGTLRVPSEETLNLYLDRVNLTNFENSCVVQMNTEKPIEEVRIEGITPKGPMLLDTHYLNDRGRLYKSIDGVVKKVFVTGDYQGTIYFNITYLDGTREVSRSYCSPGTYVIENF